MNWKKQKRGLPRSPGNKSATPFSLLPFEFSPLFLFFSECQASKSEVQQLKLGLESEMNIRQNRDLQLNELEQTLAKESQRATDLKVVY